MPQKIFFDLSFGQNLHTGMAVYVYENIRRMVMLHPENTYRGGVTLCMENIGYKKKGLYSFPTHYIPIRRNPDFYENKLHHISYNTLAQVKDADKLVFWANYVPQRPIEGNIISVIHDLNPLYEGKEDIDLYTSRIQRTLDYSQRIVTVSNYSKNEIVTKFAYNPDKIFVVHSSVDYERFQVKSTDTICETVRKKYHLPSKYFLYMGSAYENKNIKSILDAISLLPKSFLKEYKFVCSNYNKDLLEKAEALKISDNIVFLNGVDEEDKVTVYQMAQFTIFVSICEGFGLPPIESQASGVPVIASNISCIPEITGEDSALYVNPYDADDISKAIQRIAEDNELRKRLIENGYYNANKYKWDDSSEKMYKVITEF